MRLPHLWVGVGRTALDGLAHLPGDVIQFGGLRVERFDPRLPRRYLNLGSFLHFVDGLEHIFQL